MISGLERRGGNLPRIAVVDDSPFILEMWQSRVEDAVVEAFSSPEEFLRRVAQEGEFLSHLACVVTDFHFGDSSAMTGAMFALELKRLGGPKVLLSSDTPKSSLDDEQMFDGRIGECPANWLALSKVV